MSTQEQAKLADILGVGIAFAAAGFYFMLVAGGALPSPGVEGTAHGPPFIMFCAGLAFLFVGLTFVVRARAGNLESATYRILAVASVGTLATIGAWIAIGSGPHGFSLAIPSVEATAGETIGRAIFALGMVIVWIYLIALSVGAVRKLFDRRSG
jgi:hypothetical protein